MSGVWNHCLWDTFDHLFNLNKYNINQCQSFIDFLEKRSKLEEKYAKDLRKLCKEYMPKEYNKEEKVSFSVQKAMTATLKEVESVANQHDMLLSGLHKCSKEIKELMKEMQIESRSAQGRLEAIRKDIAKWQRQLDSATSNYQKAQAEMQKAERDYEANKDNKEITKNEEERYREVHMQKRINFEDRRNTLAKELTDFNNSRRQAYMQLMPEQFNRFEALERNFCQRCREQFKQWGSLELESLGIQTRCAEAMLQHADIVDADADVTQFVHITQSGNPVPEDESFERITGDIPRAGSSDSINSKQKSKGLFNTLASRRGGGPAQQKRRLEEQLAEKRTELAKAAKEKDALEKLSQSRQMNPAFADARVDQELQQSVEKFNRLQAECADLERELQSLGVDTGSRGQQQQQPQQQQQQQPHSAAADAFADEFQDESPEQQQAPPPAPPPPPPPPQQQQQQQPEPEPPGACVKQMLYDFEDPSMPDNLSVVAGERVQVLEDQDGWSLVARLDGNVGEQGYVPTQYME